MMLPTKTPRAKKAGLRQIAEAVGVSVCLASQVLNGAIRPGKARPRTIRAIRDKACELNYHRDLQAAALRAGRQNVIAVYLHCCGEPGSGIIERLTHGIASAAREHDQRLLLHHYLSPQEFRELAVAVHPKAVDGVIVGGMACRELADDLLAFRNLGLPVVTVHNSPLHKTLPNVGLNQVEVGRMATRHLIGRGCRRIAHFRVCADSAGDRYEGYRLALREAGLRLVRELVVEASGFDYESGQVAVGRLLDRGVAFDGLLGPSDAHAAAALNAIVVTGRRVPQDVKIIGVDNSPICRAMLVPLSSISQEFVVRGREAVRLLMQQVSGQVVRSIEVNPAVCDRGSTDNETLKETTTPQGVQK